MEVLELVHLNSNIEIHKWKAIKLWIIKDMNYLNSNIEIHKLKN